MKMIFFSLLFHYLKLFESHKSKQSRIYADQRQQSSIALNASNSKYDLKTFLHKDVENKIKIDKHK